MLKILICCGGGFSSSYITQKMNNEIKNKGLEKEVSLEFSPFSIAIDNFNKFDVIMCCPHLRMNIIKLLKETDIDVPIYILPPKMYGMMKLDELIIDASDIIEIFKQGMANPVHFPKEENVLRITRGVAYRNIYK